MVMDVQVVESLRARDAQAFCLLIERLQQPITGYLHRLVGNREVALDLAQDTFLHVYKEIGKTSPDLVLDAWIYRIATNYGLRYLNRRRLRHFVGLDDPSCPEDFNIHLMAPGPENQAETRILVHETLLKMKPQDCSLFASSQDSWVIDNCKFMPISVFAEDITPGHTSEVSQVLQNFQFQNCVPPTQGPPSRDW